MSKPLMLYMAALFVSCVITLALCRYAWKRRENRAAETVAVMMFGISWWTLCYTAQLMHAFFPGWIPQPEALPLFWFRLMFVGVGLLPASFLIFVMQYTGTRFWLGGRLPLVLAIFPTLVVVVALTDGVFHDWFLAGYSPERGQRFVGGPVFWMHTLYSYALTLVAYGLLIRFIWFSRTYRKQAFLLIFGGLASSVANIVTILRLMPEPLQGLDLSPFGFLVTALVMYLNIRSQGFLDVMPIARSLVFEHMSDGVLVTDAQGRLVDHNPAARQMFELKNSKRTRGRNITDIVPAIASDGEVPAEVTINNRILSVKRNRFYSRSGKLRGVVYGFRNVTELKQTEASLREQLKHNEQLRRALKEESIRDPLTGLYNRRWLNEVMAREIPRALREGQPLSFCVIDLDHFKRVNDTWGHEVGDDILRALARLLEEESRKQDVVARYGGEEFVMVLPGLAADRAAEVIERMNARLSHLDFGPECPAELSFSAGLASVPEHAEDADNLFRLADHALYKAKEQGRNRVVVAASPRPSAQNAPLQPEL